MKTDTKLRNGKSFFLPLHHWLEADGSDFFFFLSLLMECIYQRKKKKEKEVLVVSIPETWEFVNSKHVSLCMDEYLFSSVYNCTYVLHICKKKEADKSGVAKNYLRISNIFIMITKEFVNDRLSWLL